ncbi:MAG TPA: DUF6174 domain-containing protein [Woeseiaceae bacterium]|nr:DUF6174 domain-containing protein [Woeseiaceae bacterium]
MTRRKPLAGIYQLTTFLALVLLLLILFISAAYFFFVPAPDGAADDGDPLAVLAQRRSAWNAERPASFRYVVDRDCYCERPYVEPYVAIEEHGRKSAAFAIEIESPSGEFIAAPPGPVWIDDLFDLIEQSVREEKSVDVDYHKDFDFPVSIVVHPQPAPPDSVFRVEVRDFEILEYR